MYRVKPQRIIKKHNNSIRKFGEKSNKTFYIIFRNFMNCRENIVLNIKKKKNFNT